MKAHGLLLLLLLLLLFFELCCNSRLHLPVCHSPKLSLCRH